jgi:hypothetical protein
MHNITARLLRLTIIVAIFCTVTSVAAQGEPSPAIEGPAATTMIYLPLVVSSQNAQSASLDQEAEYFATTGAFAVESTYIVHTQQILDPVNAGRASYTFSLPTAGKYQIIATVDAPDFGANSLFVSIDQIPSDPQAFWTIPVTDGFEQRVVSTADGQPQAFTLSAGSHQLYLIGRERGLKIDRISIEPYTEEDSTPVPTPAPQSNGQGVFTKPTLQNPKTIVITNEKPSYYGKGTEDVIVVVQGKITKPVKISNVRNMVLIGAEFTINKPLTANLQGGTDVIRQHRAFALSNISGVAYIEGIHINNSGGGLSEAFQTFDCNNATIILRNSRIEGVRTKPGDSEFKFNHPDLFQPMSGKIYVENVTFADSDYQGLFIGGEQDQKMPALFFRNVNTRQISRQAWFFLDLPSGSVKGCENCWHDPAGSRRPNDFGYSFYPAPQVEQSSIIWQSTSDIVKGTRIQRGMPSGGDFAPANKVGLRYDAGYFSR